MVIYKFPGPTVKPPQRDEEDPGPSTKRPPAIRGRILCLAIAFLAFVWAACSWLLCFGSLVVSVATLFRWPPAIRFMQYYFRGFRRALVFTVGLTISVFSPTLGIGMICMYFMMKDTENRGRATVQVLRVLAREYGHQFDSDLFK